ncbi:formimidoylglutamase [Seonamhaeicola aphaedonensis]|uniref:Formiminoglutamase n=1 Tax=Seonamhaeicola aphaedonensis TaxID=1461338 RepID=A0A3D9HKM8_9FLAO|nr:formimidoylglutamase [Seonamhaeicola aphaedonensis]RED49456.1 formiminoglutamase [Seonamhaeicola aphaedonensis]
MDKLILFKKSNLNKLLSKRQGETKFGQHVKILTNISNIYEQLKDLDVEYVIFGIPEDIGVLANLGKSGSSKAWDATIKVLLNIQSNTYTRAKDVLLLGHLDFAQEMEQCAKLDVTHKKDLKKVRDLVSQIDTHVTYLVNQIVSAGKKPIVVGGGQNNAYGIIKGTSLALNKAINAVNLDTQSDFKPEEGRHNGNGFSYAFAEGFLGRYFVFGLHENYISEKTLTTLDKVKAVKYNTFESIEVKSELEYGSQMERALKHVSKDMFGIEIDCAAIEGISSSSMTPSGFSVNKARRFVNYFGKHEHAQYLHICEAAPKKKTEYQIGKLITYLITDFIK